MTPVIRQAVAMIQRMLALSLCAWPGSWARRSGTFQTRAIVTRVGKRLDVDHGALGVLRVPLVPDPPALAGVHDVDDVVGRRRAVVGQQDPRDPRVLDDLAAARLARRAGRVLLEPKVRG